MHKIFALVRLNLATWEKQSNNTHITLKDIFYGYYHTHKETRIPGVVATFCAPRVLYQVDASSSKHDLKNATKLPKKKKLMWCQSQVGNLCKVEVFYKKQSNWDWS